MTENQLNLLLSERERLLNAWRTADGADRMAILTRIEDIDEQLNHAGNRPVTRRILPRRFYRR
ncbi:MAG: hypothetical protein NUV48_10785 [Peptococcaceae bacterium]|nr:hypothetical protein [Peptococcaceae bacterium]